MKSISADDRAKLVEAVDGYIRDRVAMIEELDLPEFHIFCLCASVWARRESMIEEAVAKTTRFFDEPTAASFDMH